MKIDKDFISPFILLTLLFLLMFAVLIPLSCIAQPIFALPNYGVFVWLKPLAFLMLIIGACFIINIVGFEIVEKFGPK